MQKFADRLGLWSALPLGIVFALAFCPVSAATFLATVAPAARAKSPLLFSAVYGVGAAAPVVFFAGILAFQANRLGKTFQTIGKIDRISRTIAGTVFLLVGIVFSLRYCWNVSL